MSRARAWLRAARPLAHGNIAPPIVLGQAWAYAITGRFEIGAAIGAQAFGVLDHLFIVFANDTADVETDRDNTTHNLFSGGSRVIVEGMLSRAAVARAAIVCGLGLLALSVFWGRRWMPALALAAAALLWLYSYPPARLGYRGGGELLQALGLGVVLPLVGFHAQAGSLEAMPWASLAPLTLLGVAGNVSTALPDAPSDAKGGKRTWPVRRGGLAARRDALVLVCLTLATIPWVTPGLSPAGRALVVGLPSVLALSSLRDLRRADAHDHEACLRFVLLAAGAGAVLQICWAALLFAG